MIRRTPRGRAFTLVELLVVIGIIAVLISVLLPALSAARKQAQAVKCAAQLREIGNAFKLYELEYRGFWPVARVNGCRLPNGGTGPYNIDGVDYPITVPGFATPQQGYWFTLLARYVTKAKVGAAVSNDGTNAGIARQTIFYSCPAWEGYTAGGVIVGGANMVQVGFGMNPFPSFNESYPPSWFPNDQPPQSNANRPKEVAVYDPIGENPTGNFLKAKTWTRPSQRALITDSRFWLTQSNKPPGSSNPNTVYPPAVVAQVWISNTSDAIINPGVTTVDLYRHGKMPKVISSVLLDPRGGKIAYNILYCDGHVVTSNDGREAYRSTRMKFPG